MVNKLNVRMTPTRRRIKVANGDSEPCIGAMTDIPVSMGELTVPLLFLSLKSPICQKARRMSLVYNEIVRRRFYRILSAEIISPVESDWTSPVVIATKKDRPPRFCADYRRQNSVKVADRWPSPQVDNIIDDMCGNVVFRTIDLFQGIGKITIGKTCKDKQVFICRYGSFQFEIIPFVLISAQEQFQRKMIRTLFNVENVRCYVDDVVIFSKDKEDHLVYLKDVFELLDGNRLD